MGQAAMDAGGATLDDFIEPFETAQTRDGQADLAHFLPPAHHPLYLPVLRELVRIDLEYGWQRGRPLPLEDYQRRFPELFRDRPSLQAVCFEEYRQRQQAGQEPAPAEYQQRFDVLLDALLGMEANRVGRAGVPQLERMGRVGQVVVRLAKPFAEHATASISRPTSSNRARCSTSSSIRSSTVLAPASP